MFESLETRSMFSATVAVDPATSSQSDAHAVIVAADTTTSAPSKTVTLHVRKAGGEHVEF